MSAEPDYRRVLVVGAIPVRSSATGTDVTVSTLFSAWPREALMQVYLGNGGEESADLLGAPLAISPHNAPVDFALRATVGRSGVLRNSGAPPSGVVPLLGRRHVKARMHMAMRYVADVSPIGIPSQVIQAIKEFDPDVVYSLLGSLRVISMVQTIADRTGTPVVPHFMDDWPSTMYQSGELWGMPGRVLGRRLARLMKNSPAGLVISEPMAVEYSDRFGIPFTAVSNPAAVEFFEVPPRHHDQAPTFMYVGGLHLGRADVLRRFADVLAAEAGTSPESGGSRLRVHCPGAHLDLYGEALLSHSRIELGGSVNIEDVPAALSSADVLLHVESFEPSELAFTRLSVSTKLSQYLAAGRPVLCFAPGSLASARVIEASGGGLVASSEQDLRGALNALRDPASRRAMGGRGRAYARSHFSVTSMTTALRDTLAAASRAGGRGSR